MIQKASTNEWPETQEALPRAQMSAVRRTEKQHEVPA